MKRLVRDTDWRNVVAGVAALPLALLIQAETLVSYVIVFVLLATVAWQGFARWRTSKGRGHAG